MQFQPRFQPPPPFRPSLTQQCTSQHLQHLTLARRGFIIDYNTDNRHLLTNNNPARGHHGHGPLTRRMQCHHDIHHATNATMLSSKATHYTGHSTLTTLRHSNEDYFTTFMTDNANHYYGPRHPRLAQHRPQADDQSTTPSRPFNDITIQTP